MKLLSAFVIFSLILLQPIAAFASTAGDFLFENRTETGYWEPPLDGLVTRFQTTAQVAQYYVHNRIDSTYIMAVNWLGQPDTELSRAFLVEKLYAQSVFPELIDTQLQQVLDNQLPYEGWGDFQGQHSSSLLTTSTMIRLLVQLGNTNQGVLVPAAYYLLSQQMASGGWQINEFNGDHIFLNAAVLMALVEVKDSIVDSVQKSDGENAIQKGLTRIIAQANADGSFGIEPDETNKIINTALALQALLKARMNVPGVAEAISQGLNYLRAHQLPDGSWGEDPYQTALAIEALELAYPDLTVSAERMKIEPASPRVGDTVTVTAEVTNAGGMTTETALLKVTISDGNGPLNVQTVSVSPLTIGEGAILSAEWPVTAFGEYEAKIEISYDSDQVAENNTALRVFRTMAPADLTIADPMIAGELVSGSGRDGNPAPTIMAILRNIGGLEARNVIVGCYDGDPAAGGTAIGAVFVPLLAAGISETVAFVWAAVAGEHQIYIVADPGNQVGELREDNNSAVVPVSVEARADLTFATSVVVTPYESLAGEQATVEVRVDNVGSAASAGVDLTVYAAPSPLPSPPLGGGEGTTGGGKGTFAPGLVGWELVWTGNVGVLAAGGGESITIPVTTTAKSVAVVVDEGNAIAEEREDNNLMTVALRERAGADLRIFLAGNSASLPEGDAVTFPAIVENAGDVAGEAGEIVFAVDGIELGRQSVGAMYPVGREYFTQVWTAEYGTHTCLTG